MNTNLRKLIALAAISGSVLTAGVGAATAQTSSTTASTTVAAGTARPQNGGFSAHAPAIAKALGMTTDELKTARSGGKTIAQLATEKGVDLSKIIATYVAEEQAEHPEMSAADVLKRVTDSVNNVRPTGTGNRGPRTKPATTVAPTSTATVAA